VEAGINKIDDDSPVSIGDIIRYEAYSYNVDVKEDRYGIVIEHNKSGKTVKIQWFENASETIIAYSNLGHLLLESYGKWWDKVS